MSEEAFKKGFEAGWFSHSSGRTCSMEQEMSEALKDLSWETAPEAPKVEQEPVGSFIFTGNAWEQVHDAFTHHHDVIALYRHPAPAGDEMLEALGVIQDKLKFCTDAGPEGEGWLSKELEQAWSVVSDYINQHRGPQP